MTETVRVRFAPSPTGPFHVGSLRTALYNYLFARRSGGVFIVRIEDTDRTRLVPGAVEDMVDSLRWAGIDFDEGPGVGGPHAPYFQSERLPLYRQAVDRLVAAGHAYPCFCTPERLKELRDSRQELKLSTKYDRHCLRLPAGERREKLAAGVPHVIRMQVPDEETVTVTDLVRGTVRFSPEIMDDQVLLKSDGFPTYHLANVVDDHAMEITDVIRGEEWLSSTPKHVLLYRFLGYEPPRFAHLPLLLNPDRSKLSKRHGDVAVRDYRAQGYLPEALVNFVAFLGWNPGDDREVFSLEELVRDFSLERVNKSGAIFNLEKLRWYQQAWLRRRPAGEILEELKGLLDGDTLARFRDEDLLALIGLMRERVDFVREYPEKSAWFFQDPHEYDAATLHKRWTNHSGHLLDALLPGIEGLPSFTAAALEELIKKHVERTGLKMGEIVHPLRLAVSGVGGGPGLYEMMEVLGRETCLRRIRRAIQVLPRTGPPPSYPRHF